MYRKALLLCSSLILALALAACGGDDDDDTGNTSASPTSGAAAATSGGSTPAAGAPTPTEAAAETPASTEATPTVSDAGTPTSSGGGSAAPEGAPTPEDPNFPDVFAELAVGVTAEVDTGDDLNQQPGRTRITIDDIRDGVEPASQFYELQPGFKLWVVDVTIESIGDGGIPLPEVFLETSDGSIYEWVGGTDLGPTPLFMELPSGDTVQGIYAFEIPEDATILWLLVDPSIYVGRNIVFLP